MRAAAAAVTRPLVVGRIIRSCPNRRPLRDPLLSASSSTTGGGGRRPSFAILTTTTRTTKTTTRTNGDDGAPPEETAAASGAAAAVSAVAARLKALDAAVAALAAARPDVDGLGKLRSRIRRDLRRCVGESAGAHALDGARNNARGFAAEVAVACAAPRVVAVCFSAAAAQSCSSSSSSASSVEVDVVCEGGATWVEVKAHRPFSTASAHWSSSPSSSSASLSSARRGGGLKEQAAALLAAARDEGNRAAGFRAPRVAVLFSHGVDPSVARELEEMGAIALGQRVLAAGTGAGAGADGGGGGEDKEVKDEEGDDEDEDDAVAAAACRAALVALPPLPPSPYPYAINLDVTALCALVSEVSWAGGRAGDADESEALDAWAARTSHWRACLAAERAGPLLFRYDGPPPPVERGGLRMRAWGDDTALARAGRALLGQEEEEEGGGGPAPVVIASAAAVRQFDALAALHAGERERTRWGALRARLEVVEVAGGEGEGGGEGDGGGGTGGGQGGQQGGQQSAAAATPLALAVLSLGGRRRAVTATANGSGVRSAREHWARRRQRRPEPGGGGGGGGGSGGDGVPPSALSVGGGWTDDAAAGALEVELHRPVWLAGV